MSRYPGEGGRREGKKGRGRERGREGRERGKGREGTQSEALGMRHMDRDATGRTTEMPQANPQPKKASQQKERGGRAAHSQSTDH